MKFIDMTYYDALSTVPLFKDFEPSELRKLAMCASRLDFDADAIIYHAGELGKGLYIVQQGRVAIEMDLGDQGIVPLYMLGPGELFGWSSLIQGRRKKARARAAEPAGLLFLDIEQIRDFTRYDYKFSDALMNCVIGVIAERMYLTRERLARHTARMRV
ncbi:MAG: hypothetical protein Kow0031_27700 [Anaerolineae bacterium]